MVVGEGKRGAAAAVEGREGEREGGAPTPFNLLPIPQPRDPPWCRPRGARQKNYQSKYLSLGGALQKEKLLGRRVGKTEGVGGGGGGERKGVERGHHKRE